MYPLWKLPDVKLAPDVIFCIGGGNPAANCIGGFPVSNTLLCTWISIIALVALFYFGSRRRALIPSGIQNVVEVLVEFLLGLVEGVAGKEKGKKFFPLVATFFLFILVSNLLDIFPGVDTIGQFNSAAAQSHAVFGFLLFGNVSNQIVPWIRPATADLNLTFAMALVSVIVTQIFGFYTLGVKEHIGKFFNIKALLKFNFGGFVEFFVGVLELIGEVTRVISFAFRLFGNIFAGSIVLAVFAFLLPFVSDVIFIPFEIFVAFVQALVFSLLTLVFLQIATTSHTAHEADDHQEAHEKAEVAVR